jgi:hypothetical protein
MMRAAATIKCRVEVQVTRHLPQSGRILQGGPRLAEDATEFLDKGAGVGDAV